MSILSKKYTGATFTPKSLADFLSERVLQYIRSKNIKVLDPACGEGELLISIGEVLANNGIDYCLTGFDSNAEYLEIAKERLAKLNGDDTQLIHGDFLTTFQSAIEDQQLTIEFNSDSCKYDYLADLIIANPPYVRTQILGSNEAQLLAKKFNLKGRVDLYYPFLIAMTQRLKVGGVIAVITSNRYLSTKSGESIREFLSKNYEILELIDLGDTKIFDAAVLPAILIGRKLEHASAPDQARFVKLYEERNGYKGKLKEAGNIYEILNTSESGYFVVGDKRYKKTEGKLRYGKGNTWQLLSKAETGWTAAIEANKCYVIGDLFKVRVGIKTTADKVFIRDNWDSLVDSPENELLRELISNDNIKRWSISKNPPLKVLYPHYSENGLKKVIDLDRYPCAKRYLTQFEEPLKARTYLIEAGRKWFEIWVPQNPKLWARPKLVFPDISATPRFYFDEGGKIANGNCYWIVAEREEDIDKLLLIQGVANSNLMTKYHDLVFNNKLYAGRRRYLTQYVERYPLPDADSEVARNIVKTVKKLNNSAEEKIPDLEKELEVMVAYAFGVEPVFNLD